MHTRYRPSEQLYCSATSPAPRGRLGTRPPGPSCWALTRGLRKEQPVSVARRIPLVPGGCEHVRTSAPPPPAAQPRGRDRAPHLPGEEASGDEASGDGMGRHVPGDRPEASPSPILQPRKAEARAQQGRPRQTGQHWAGGSQAPAPSTYTVLPSSLTAWQGALEGGNQGLWEQGRISMARACRPQRDRAVGIRAVRPQPIFLSTYEYQASCSDTLI